MTEYEMVFAKFVLKEQDEEIFSVVIHRHN